MIDVSDGLASEAHHLSQAGIVGVTVEGGFLPVHVQTYQAAERFDARPEAYALYGGEDYELLFTMPEADVAKLDEGTVAVVGQIVEPEEGRPPAPARRQPRAAPGRRVQALLGRPPLASSTDDASSW